MMMATLALALGLVRPRVRIDELMVYVDGEQQKSTFEASLVVIVVRHGEMS
jgi:hypothetical protein